MDKVRSKNPVLVSLSIVLYALAGVMTGLLWAQGLSSGPTPPVRRGVIVAGVLWPVLAVIVIAENIEEVLGWVSRHE